VNMGQVICVLSDGQTVEVLSICIREVIHHIIKGLYKPLEKSANQSCGAERQIEPGEHPQSHKGGAGESR